MIDPHPIRQRFTSLSPHLSERERRLFAAIEARAARYGGIAAVSAATGIAVSTIGRGLKELSALDTLAPDRVRRPGGGRKLLVEKDATLLNDLLALVEPSERGDPRPSACCRRAWPAGSGVQPAPIRRRSGRSGSAACYGRSGRGSRWSTSQDLSQIRSNPIKP